MLNLSAAEEEGNKSRGLVENNNNDSRNLSKKPVTTSKGKWQIHSYSIITCKFATSIALNKHTGFLPFWPMAISSKSGINGSTSSSCQLDLLLPPGRRYPFHRALRDASFFTAVDPNDASTKTRRFRWWKRFQIAFMCSLCLRLLVECLTPAGSPVLLYLGDFKGTRRRALISVCLFFFSAVYFLF